MQDKCAVFGIYGHTRAAHAAYDALHMQNHRGDKSSGMVAADGTALYEHKGMGLVPEVYKAEDLERLQGAIAIGHNRYATCGAGNVLNIQPFIVTTTSGLQIAVASNGDLPWYAQQKQRVVEAGYEVASENDGELIGWYIAWGYDQTQDMVQAMHWAMEQLDNSAFSCVVCTVDTLYAMRDPRGMRPMCLGKLGNAYVIASETVAFDILQARYIRDIEPGTIVRINTEGERTFLSVSMPHRHCDFELQYFARPDSLVYGLSVSEIREAQGRLIAQKSPVAAEVVIGVPDSGLHGALGYSEASGIPFKFGFIRHHFSRREFILDGQASRDMQSKYKHNPDRRVVAGKRVVMVDDSIVRGTASRKLVRMLRNAGAREVHLRIITPPIIGPCFFGIDTPTLQELIASRMSIEEMRAYIEADSLVFLSLAEMHACIPLPASNFCSACMTRHYPMPLPPEKQFAELSS
ncbi:MAG: amidophosphoribosyltransferase [Patescibacteria group bacterium]